jgi:hypothetical protein
MERERSGFVPEARHRGPNLGALGVVYTALFLGSLVVVSVGINAGNGSLLDKPSPTESFNKQGSGNDFVALGIAQPIAPHAYCSMERDSDRSILLWTAQPLAVLGSNLDEMLKLIGCWWRRKRPRTHGLSDFLKESPHSRSGGH